jgi:TRAP transporter TAXI family solute receptor
VRIKLLDHADAIPKLVQKWGPLYVKGTIAAKSYPGQDADVQGADVWNLLVVSDKMDEKLAYEITKATFEHKDELAGVHAEAKNLDLQRQYAVGSPVPFHPGAVRYFTEKGLKPPK